MKLDSSVELVLEGKKAEVFSIGADALVYDALVLMAEKQIGALLVMKSTALVGILSERDYARKVILAGLSSREVKVREIMSSPVITVTREDTVDHCMQHMTKKRCRHLPVIESGKPVAVVSLGDLVRWIIEFQHQTINDLEDYISGEYPGLGPVRE
jgi:CBS domain-containing protein